MTIKCFFCKIFPYGIIAYSLPDIIIITNKVTWVRGTPVKEAGLLHGRVYVLVEYLDSNYLTSHGTRKHWFELNQFLVDF